MKTKYFDEYNKVGTILILNKNESSIAKDCMKKNISFQLQTKNGFIIYIANSNNTKGLLLKIEDGKEYTADENGNWIESNQHSFDFSNNNI